MLFFLLCTYAYMSWLCRSKSIWGRSGLSLLCCSHAPCSWSLTTRLCLLAGEPRKPPGLIYSGPRGGTQSCVCTESTTLLAEPSSPLLAVFWFLSPQPCWACLLTSFFGHAIFRIKSCRLWIDMITSQFGCFLFYLPNCPGESLWCYIELDTGIPALFLRTFTPLIFGDDVIYSVLTGVFAFSSILISGNIFSH